MLETSDLEPLLRRLLAQTHEISIVLLDQDGLVIGWSGAAQICFGYRASEMVGEWFGQLFTKEDVDQRVPEHELSVALSGTSAEDDRWLLRKDGGRIWVTGITTALLSESGALLGFAKVVRDRTDLKTQMDREANKVASLEKDNQRLEVLVNEFGSQLNASLTQMAEALDLLRGLESPDSQACLVTLTACANEMQGLAAQSLGTFPPSAQGWELDFFPVELGALINDFAQGLMEPFALRGISVRVVVPKAVIVQHVNPGKITRLLAHLASNALRHTASGGTTWLTLTVESSSVAIRMRDTGEGIAPEVLPAIFDLFSKEVKTASTDGKGGLHMVKSIAEEHGGTVEIRSAGLGHGSEFTLRLPR